MKILFIAMSDSIHTARWIDQVADQRWNLYLYPSQRTNKVHPLIARKINICLPFLLKDRGNLVSQTFYKFYHKMIKRLDPYFNEKRLHRYIRKIRPDIIHTLETQSAGYLLSRTRKKYYTKKNFPVWWHTNWGSDIFLFGRLKDHKDKIREVLIQCDYYSCESVRDVELAKDFGFNKTVMPVYPNTGGFRPDLLLNLRSEEQTCSKRKQIMLKGYQGWAGRAFAALRALSLVKDLLEGFSLVIYSCEGRPVELAAELFSLETGVDVRILPSNTDHDEILINHGKARISIGLSISDSISTSVLEAMAMSSFPIQSNTSTAGEWFQDGVSGFLVPPEDPEIIAEAIRKALSDDDLVDRASEINREIIKSRLDYNDLKEKTVNSYKKIMADIEAGR
jgi:glycosyltransferase involved in cell wall biosynthesis